MKIFVVYGGRANSEAAIEGMTNVTAHFIVT
jgi:hypothetical protein